MIFHFRHYGFIFRMVMFPIFSYLLAKSYLLPIHISHKNEAKNKPKIRNLVLQINEHLLEELSDKQHPIFFKIQEKK